MAWQNVTSTLIAARPRGLWTLVVDYVDAPAVLKIVAADDGAWIYTPGIRCGADGDPTSMIARARCLHAKGPVGALIGKVGGSTAGIDDGRIFLVGHTGVIGIDEDEAGPLFLTINDEPTGFDNNSGSIAVKVVRRI